MVRRCVTVCHGLSLTLSRLSDVRFTVVKTAIDLSGVTVDKVTGDFPESSLAKAIDKPEVNNRIVQSWREKARESSSRQVVYRLPEFRY